MAGQQPAPLPNFGLFLGSNYTLACAQGAFSQSGIAVGLSVTEARGVPAPMPLPHLSSLFAQGASNPAPLPHFSSLFAGGTNIYLMPCDVGVFTYTGSEVLADYQVSMNQGTLTLTGYDAGTKRGYTLVMEAGSQGLQGQAAQLLRGTQFLLESGNYSLVGQNVSLNKAAPKTLICSGNTFLLTGNNVSFPIIRGLACGYGSFTITGGDTFLRYTEIQKVTVPYLINSTQDAAQKMIEAIYCVPSFIGSGGTVQAQSPANGTIVPRGTTISATMGGPLIQVKLHRRRGLPRYGCRE